MLGIEAVSTEKLDRFNKKTDQDQNLRSLQILKAIGIFAIPHILVSPEMTPQDFEDISRFIEEGEFEYPVAIPLTPLPGTDDFSRYKVQGRIITEKLDFYTFMYNVVEPASMTREFDRHYDRLIFRMWSWSRFVRGKRGRTSFLAFLKWWAFVRILVLQLRWRRGGDLSRGGGPAAPAPAPDRRRVTTSSWRRSVANCVVVPYHRMERA